MEEDDLLLLESSRLVHRVLLSEGMLRSHAPPSRLASPEVQQAAPVNRAFGEQAEEALLLDDATERLLLEGAGRDVSLLGGSTGLYEHEPELEVDLAQLGEILAHGTGVGVEHVIGSIVPDRLPS